VLGCFLVEPPHRKGSSLRSGPDASSTAEHRRFLHTWGVYGNIHVSAIGLVANLLPESQAFPVTCSVFWLAVLSYAIFAIKSKSTIDTRAGARTAHLVLDTLVLSSSHMGKGKPAAASNQFSVFLS
jgi:hypothetical protein